MGAFDLGGVREPGGRDQGPFARRFLSPVPESGGEVRRERRRFR